MSHFNIVVETNEATVVTEYKPVVSKSTSYQSEAELEKEFIKLLQEQGYEYLTITKEEDLIKNLRKQLELLNNIIFSDKEWTSFFTNNIANPNSGIVEKTRIIQEDYRQLLKRDDGTTKNINEFIYPQAMTVVTAWDRTGLSPTQWVEIGTEHGCFVVDDEYVVIPSPIVQTNELSLAASALR